MTAILIVSVEEFPKDARHNKIRLITKLEPFANKQTVLEATTIKCILDDLNRLGYTAPDQNEG